MKARKFWKRGLALALSLALLITLVPTAFAEETKTPKTSSEAVDEMTWGVNLADLYMADIQPDEGATTGYDNFTPTAELGIAVWFWDDSFEWLTYHGSQRGTFTVHAPLPTYSSSTDKPFIRLGFFAKKPNQAFDVTLSDSKIVKSNQTEVSLPSLDTRYQGNAASEPDMNGWYSYALWDLPNLPEESAEYNGATFYTTVTINEGSVTTTSKADYYFEYGRTPIDQEDLTDTFLNEGANVIRLPVTWTWFVNDQTFEIDDEWLAAVKTEVDYILSKGAYCILDMHDDYMKRSFVATKNASTGQWENFKWTQDWMTGHAYDSLDGAAPSERPATPYDEYVDARFAEVWRQIAEYFKGCSDKLIFEACNEPTELWFDGVHYDEWIKAQAARVNELNQLFVNTVRATGGNNADRLLCLAVAEYNQHQHLSKLTPPKNDNYLMVQVHSYGEMEGKSDSGFQGYQTETDTLFNDVKTFQMAYPNIPVIVGEVGISHAAANIGSESNKAAAAEKVAYFYQKATENGVPCLWWEDYFRVPEEGSSDTYWLYDKTAKKWGRPEILAAIKSNAKAGTSTPVETALTSVTLSENTVTVQGGNAADIAVTAAAKDQAGGTFADVTWSISGGDAANVTIDPASGVITVKAKAKAGSYTVTATDSNSKTATATLTVKRAESRATTMTVSGGQNEILVPADNAANNASAAFTASVTDQFDDVFSGNVAWSISPATEGVSIGTDGVVTVTNAAKAAVTDTVGKQLTVTAACSGISGTAAIQVKRAASQVTTVSLTRGGAAVGGTDTLVIPAAGTAEYTYAVKVLDQYGAEMEGQTPVWTFTPTTADANVTFDNAGKVTVTAGAAANGTFTLKAEVGGQSAETTITVKDISISWPAANVSANPTYGQQWSQIITLSGGSATLNGQPVTGSFTVKEANTYPTVGSQSYTVNFTSTDGAYNIDKTYEAVTIAQKSVTVTAENKTKVYGEANPALTFTVPAGSLVGDDTKDDLGVALTCAATVTSPAGTPVDITGSSTSANYNVTVKKGTLTINKAAITGYQTTAPTATILANSANNTAANLKTAASLPANVTVTFKDGTSTLPIVWANAAEKFNVKGGTYTFKGTVTPGTNFNAYTTPLTATLTVTPVTGTLATPLTTPVVIAKSAAEKATSYAAFKLPASITINCDNGVAAQTIAPEWSVPLNTLKTKAVGSKTSVKVTNVPEWLTIADSALTVEVQITDKFPVTVTVAPITDVTFGTAVGNPSASQTAIDDGTDASGTYTYRYTGTTAAGKAYNSDEKPTAAGDYTVTATLVSDTHAGSGSTTFKITPKPLADSMIAAIPDETYNKTAHTPVLTVTDGAALVLDTDYTVEYTNNVNAGTATAVVSGKWNYTGTVNQSFTIQPKDISAAKASITGTSEVDYALLASVSGADPTAGFTYNWYVDGTKADGNLIYLFLKEEYKDKEITVTATAGSGNYAGTTAASEPVTVAQAREEIVSSEVPGKPEMTVKAGNKQISVTAAAESEKPAALYEVRLYDADGGALGAYFTTNSTYTISGLTNGTAYQVSVVAYNINGGSTESDKTSVTPKASTPSTPSTPSGGDTTPDEPEDPTEPVVETETAADGTVTTTTTWPDGKKAVQENAPDGSAKVEVTSSTGETIAKIDLPADPGAGKDFTDVKSGAWYESAVNKVTAYGLFDGASATTFEPDGSMTRGMVAQVLYNLSGKTGYGAGSGTFADVAAGKWYENAIDWAAKADVVSGMGNGKFSPEQVVTREQLVTMLYNYAKVIGAGTQSTADLEGFPDGNSVSNYAKAAVQWAVAEGFISGRAQNGKNYIAPKGTATRAEVAVVLTKFLEYLK